MAVTRTCEAAEADTPRCWRRRTRFPPKRPSSEEDMVETADTGQARGGRARRQTPSELEAVREMEPFGDALGNPSVVVSLAVQGKFWRQAAEEESDDGLDASSHVSPAPEVSRRSPPAMAAKDEATVADAARRRRLTLAPGGMSHLMLPEIVGRSPPSGSCFSCLEVSDDGESGDESCSSEVPFEAALDVLDEQPAEEGWSTVAKRGRQSDEELRQPFWAEMGFPTPTSRFWEAWSPSSEGTDNVSSACRSAERERIGTSASTPVPSRSSLMCSAQTLAVRIKRRPRAGVWRGPVPPRRVSLGPVLGQFIARAVAQSMAGAGDRPVAEEPSAPIATADSAGFQMNTKTVPKFSRGPA
ncbi:hypothetical protein ACQ4PT_023705 [Festuca glaucescens]